MAHLWRYSTIYHSICGYTMQDNLILIIYYLSIIDNSYNKCRYISLVLMDYEYNKNLATRLYTEIYAKWQFDEVDEVIHENYNINDQTVTLIHNEGAMPLGTGRASFIARVKYIKNAIPDTHYEILYSIADEDKVMTWWNWSGTQKGELFGFESKGKTMKISGSSIFKIKDDRIINATVIFDSLSLLIQLGHVNITTVESKPIRKYVKKMQKLTFL